MSDEAAPGRITVIWAPEARAGLRTIEREAAMQILHCVDRYLASRAGGVKKLQPPRTGFRLRCGDYRMFFDLEGCVTRIGDVHDALGTLTEPRSKVCGIGQECLRHGLASSL
jgi:mRNA-degrading endonuclease RelE of RelBE toxin-antitoxin system